MESTRDVRRLIEKEIKKGSAPLTFDHMEYPKDALHEVTSESELKRVFVYLLRIAEFEELENDMTRNNVYTDHHLIRGDSFHRRNNVMERNANYLSVMAYARQCQPDYEHKTYAESVSCYFAFPEEELEKYRFVYKGMETFAFPLSGKHIINGLYLMSLMHRRALTAENAPDYIEGAEDIKIYHLTDIRRVLFQCLLLDDMHLNNGLYEAKLNTIYLLE